MIKTNPFKANEEKDKEFKFNLFGQNQNVDKDERTLKIGAPAKCFNLSTIDGTLKSGYGIKDLAMPQNEIDLDNESVVAIRGNEVKSIWKLKWYNPSSKKNCYYLFYFNDENLICFDNLFATRLAPFIIENEFTDTPFATYYRKDGQDAILLSGEGGNLTVISGDQTFTSANAPRIIDCVNHYGKIFAITAEARGRLVYNETPDVLDWSDEKTKNLDFSDERGDLTKIISFNDYLYVFREFGITEISEYGSDGNFAISHIYQSSAVIEPNSIAQVDGKIFFLEGNKIKSFNGSSVKGVELDCFDYLKAPNQRNCWATGFEGKYYLACRGDFGDEKVVGCEDGEFVNNMLMIYSVAQEHVDILRGVDIKQMLAFNNIFKSKLILIFNNTMAGHIGQLTTNGEAFGQNQYAYWQSGTTDFELPGKVKRIKHFTIQTKGECKVSFISDMEEKAFKVLGSDKLQKINANIIGKTFTIKIEVDDCDVVDIGQIVISLSERQ